MIPRAPSRAHAHGAYTVCLGLTIFIIDVLVGQMRALVQDHVCVPDLGPSRAEGTPEGAEPDILPVLVCGVEGEKCREEKPACGVELRKERHEWMVEFLKLRRRRTEGVGSDSTLNMLAHGIGTPKRCAETGTARQMAPCRKRWGCANLPLEPRPPLARPAASSKASCSARPAYGHVAAIGNDHTPPGACRTRRQFLRLQGIPKPVLTRCALGLQNQTLPLRAAEDPPSYIPIPIPLYYVAMAEEQPASAPAPAPAQAAPAPTIAVDVRALHTMSDVKWGTLADQITPRPPTTIRRTTRMKCT
jgi:hypothetical protein